MAENSATWKWFPMKCGICLRKREENNLWRLNNKFFLQVFIFTASWSAVLSQTDCKLRKDEEGIKVYTCSSDTSKFKSIKVECTMNTSIEKIESFLLDFDN